MLSLSLLRAFVAVVENDSFTRAGNELFRSQSAISMQVRRLEAILGVPVFNRDAKAVELSPQGRIFLDYARRILHLSDEALSAVSSGQLAQTVRLGCIEDFASRHLPSILVDTLLRDQIKLVTSVGESSDLLKGLGSSFDVVIAMHPVGTGTGRVLRREKIVWAGSAEQAPPSMGDLVMVVLRPENCIVSQYAQAALETAGRPWQCAYLTSGIGTFTAAVEDGLAVGAFKESLLRPSLRRLTEEEGFPDLPEVEISLHLSDTGAASFAAQCLCGQIEASLGKR